MAIKESRRVGQVTEITLVVPFKKGGPRGLGGVRYADRCRIVLDAFTDLEAEGFVSPVRRFGGIHFARWALMDGDTRLLFTTNFDGSWDDYIADFVRQIPWSLGLIWSNCEGYPPDRRGPDGKGLIPGAADYALLSKFVRRYQVPAGLFYAHYGELAVRDIRFLQIFHEETCAGLAERPPASLAQIQRRSMERQAALTQIYGDGLPARPFPDPASLTPMPPDQKEVLRARIGPPIERLYDYDKETMEQVYREFRIAATQVGP